jgi:peptidoglycan/LPS O-acetylase OafA/YrhL
MMSPKPQACSFPHLDLLRACSCLIVFTVHFQIIADKTALPWKYAHGSVIIFFVLSGYLISLSIANTASFWQYLRKRSLRIYSVYAPALICSILICDIDLIDTHSLKLLFFYDAPSLSHQVNNQPIWSLSFLITNEIQLAK